MVEISGIVLLMVALFVGAILAGTILVSGIGSLANATKGSACTNCQPTTKTMLQNTEIFIALGALLAFIGIGIAAIKGRK